MIITFESTVEKLDRKKKFKKKSESKTERKYIIKENPRTCQNKILLIKKTDQLKTFVDAISQKMKDMHTEAEKDKIEFSIIFDGDHIVFLRLYLHSLSKIHIQSSDLSATRISSR